MKTFKFKVTVVDTYKDEIEIKANTLEEAKEKLEHSVEACPIESRSNTLDYSEKSVELFLNKKWVSIDD